MIHACRPYLCSMIRSAPPAQYIRLCHVLSHTLTSSSQKEKQIQKLGVHVPLKYSLHPKINSSPRIPVVPQRLIIFKQTINALESIY